MYVCVFVCEVSVCTTCPALESLLLYPPSPPRPRIFRPPPRPTPPGFDLGQPQDQSYFRQGEAGYHAAWDSRCLNYGHWEVQRYLLSNLRYWLDEFQFDGFR